MLAGLLFLFVPVRYHVQIEREESCTAEQSGKARPFQAQISIHWLLHLVHAAVGIQGTDVKVKAKLFGYPIVGRERKKKSSALTQSVKVPEEPREEENRAEEIRAEEPSVSEEELFVTEAEPQKQTEEETAEETVTPPVRKADKPEEKKKRNSFARIADKLRNIRESYQKVKASFAYYQRVWYDEHTVNARRHVIREIRFILRHYRPSVQRGWVIFGLDDPALTGQVLGGLYALQGMMGGKIEIEADFERLRLEGNVSVKGHIRLCHLVKTVLSLFFDKDVRVMIKKLRKMQGKPEN